MEEWKVKDLIRHLRLVRYLLSSADNRGLTHGEKHHLIVVAIMTLDKAMSVCGEDGLPSRFDDSSIPETPQVSDIPF